MTSPQTSFSPVSPEELPPLEPMSPEDMSIPASMPGAVETKEQELEQDQVQDQVQEKIPTIALESKKSATAIAATTVPAKRKKGLGIYMLTVFTRKVTVPFTAVGANIKEVLQKKLIHELEGRCVLEGFIKPNSVRVINYSSGTMVSNTVVFQVMIECLVCSPVEGMKFKVKVVNITKAGIRAETGVNSPVDVFIARDHHYANKYFSTVKIGDTVTIRVIGQRYEINDTRISVIAELMKPKLKKGFKLKPRLIVKESL
jgi:DNA-directed RNA polymerase subunit E'/Rpb7